MNARELRNAKRNMARRKDPQFPQQKTETCAVCRKPTRHYWEDDAGYPWCRECVRGGK